MGSISILPKLRIASLKGVLQSMMSNGVGRTLLKLNEKHGLVPHILLKDMIRFTKIIRSPIDWLQRVTHSKMIRRNSRIQDLPDETGYREIGKSEFPESDAIVSQCYELVRLRSSHFNGKSHFELPLFDNSIQTISRENKATCDLTQIDGLIEFVLNEEMLKIASAYLGEVPIIGSVNLYVTKPNTDLQGSQLFHFDGLARKEIQFVFAITDIDEDCGPFTFFTADVCKKINKFISPRQYRKSDDEVFRVLNPNKLIKMTGPRGSGWIIDTSRCLHFGSRTETKLRCHLQIHYVTAFSSGEPQSLFTLFKAKLPDSLTTLQKLVVSKMNFV